MKTLIRKAKGFTLMEMMIVLAVIGIALSIILYYHSRTTASMQSTQTVQAVSNMAAKLRSFYQPVGSYNGVSSATVNNMQLVTPPLSWDGTNIRDPWGNTVAVVGNASGAAPSFVITLGGATQALDKEVCANMATALAPGADVVQVGAQATLTTTNGLVGAGAVYKSTPTATVSVANLTGASGCGSTSPVIGLQYH